MEAITVNASDKESTSRNNSEVNEIHYMVRDATQRVMRSAVIKHIIITFQP